VKAALPNYTFSTSAKAPTSSATASHRNQSLVVLIGTFLDNLVRTRLALDDALQERRSSLGSRRVDLGDYVSEQNKLFLLGDIITHGHVTERATQVLLEHIAVVPGIGLGLVCARLRELFLLPPLHDTETLIQVLSGLLKVGEGFDCVSSAAQSINIVHVDRVGPTLSRPATGRCRWERVGKVGVNLNAGPAVHLGCLPGRGVKGEHDLVVR
jgi:hypothetical protein